MFEKFSDDSKKILSGAKAIAEEMKSKVIGTEHIILAILKEEDLPAAEILRKSGADPDKIKRIAAAESGMSFTNAEPHFSERVVKILKMAENSFGAFSEISPEHILLALLSVGDSFGSRALYESGADLQKIYNELIKAVRGEGNEFESDGFEDESEYFGGNEKNTASGGKKKGILAKYSRDLTEYARQNKTDPVIGREKELERVIQIISRRTKNNPCLIGEAGVGKTAIAEGLAQKIVSGDVPEEMLDKKIISLDLASLIAGTKYRGEFEQRIKAVIDEASKDKSIILFIDEIHTIIGAGASEGSMDASNILKPYLARGEIRLIGATTLAEYRLIEKDAAFERRFQPVTVKEPSIEDAIEILRGLKPKYEEHHKLKIGDDAVISAVELSSRYIADRFLPDKAIDLIDEASSRKKLQKTVLPKELSDKQKELDLLEEQKKKCADAEKYEEAGELLKKIKAEKEILDKEKKAWEEKSNSEKTVGKEDIAAVVTQWTGIPVQSLLEEESEKLKRLEEELSKRVIGQSEAISAVSRAIRRARSGIRDPKKPMGSFIFAGSTGVGKTELSKALAQLLFGSENKMIRVDMSEFMEKHSVSKLIGSPPGYVGFDDGGQLTEKIRRNPYSVILFDEIEKAHPAVFDLLLQVLDDGILTDSHGRKVDFKNTIIIMTSNCGVELLKEKKTLGFNTGASSEEKSDSELILSALKNSFRPEFLNRLDEIIVFRRLDRDNVRIIVKKLFAELKERLKQSGLEIEFSDALTDHIADVGFDPANGARPLKRAIQKEIEDSLSLEIISGKFPENSKIFADYKENAVIFRIRDRD